MYDFKASRGDDAGDGDDSDNDSGAVVVWDLEEGPTAGSSAQQYPPRNPKQRDLVRSADDDAVDGLPSGFCLRIQQQIVSTRSTRKLLQKQRPMRSGASDG